MYLFCASLSLTEISFVIPTSQTKKMKERELPNFPGNKWQSWDANPNSPAPKNSLLSVKL